LVVSFQLAYFNGGALPIVVPCFAKLVLALEVVNNFLQRLPSAQRSVFAHLGFGVDNSLGASQDRVGQWWQAHDINPMHPISNTQLL